MDDQTIKADAGKAKLTLVDTQLIKVASKLAEYEQEATELKKPLMLFKTEKKGNHWKAMFQCQYCWNLFEANISNVLSGRQKSCGCAKGKILIQSKGTHGESNTRLYRIYQHIKERCNNPNCREYKWYGARGISCEFESFEDFRDYALSHGYRDDLSCERIDVNGNYAKGNVTFIPLRLQARNTRSNVMLTYKGLTLCAAEWAEILGLNPDTITKRKRSGWSDEKCLSKGKIDLQYIPTGIISAIRATRLYGISKYGDSESWHMVDRRRYQDAAYRHWLAYLDDPNGVDEESGLPHLWHLACNIAFLCEMEDEE